MRYESTVTSLSWIPSEAVTGGTKAAFEGGFAHYDQPPPGELGKPGEPDSVTALRAADRFRFATCFPRGSRQARAAGSPRRATATTATA